MKNTEITTISVQKYTCTLYASSKERIVYIMGSEHIEGKILEMLAEKYGISIAAVGGIDWNADMSPWPAPGVFRQAGDFAGCGGEFLKILTDEIVPAAETALIKNADRAILGVSLAGLFSIYSVFKTAIFGRAASISGSMWYDGFIDYMKTHELPGDMKKFYFSLGDKEKKSRNPRMAQVETCTQEAVSLLREKGISVFFEMNPGNHFVDGELRMEKAISHLWDQGQIF